MRLTDTQVRIIKTHPEHPRLAVRLPSGRRRARRRHRSVHRADRAPGRCRLARAALQRRPAASLWSAAHRRPRTERTAETDPRDGQAIRRRSVNDLAARLARVLDLVDREARHLAEVTQRFFGDAGAVDREWLAKQLATIAAAGSYAQRTLLHLSSLSSGRAFFSSLFPRGPTGGGQGWAIRSKTQLCSDTESCPQWVLTKPYRADVAIENRVRRL
jgi:hypothetical protein